MRSPRAVAALAAALVLSVAVPPASSEFLLGPGCSVLAVSPDFARDRTAACAGVVVVGGEVVAVTVGITIDGGRTWLQAPGAGLKATWFDAVTALSFSPRYRADRTIYLHTTDGLYSSVTLGAAWTAVSPVPTGDLDDLATWESDGAVQLGMVGAGRTDSVVLSSPPEVAPALGSTADDRRLIALPGAPPTLVMLAERSPPGDDNTTRRQVEAYACDARLMCSSLLHAWPTGTSVHQTGVLGDNRTAYAVIRSGAAGAALTFWTSADRGVTWRPWSSLGRAYSAVHDADSWTSAGIAAHPSQPRLVYARFLGLRDRGRLDDVVLRSDDAGATWRRVFDAARTPPPWFVPAAAHRDESADITLTGDGRLFVLAMYLDSLASGAFQSFVGRPYCSTDGGRMWAPSCS